MKRRTVIKESDMDGLGPDGKFVPGYKAAGARQGERR